ncbi:MAG TPA: succinate dehydrogenase assembly factor 2, partial [Rhodanobacteraceae bacterium]|nr:succinate dehydrogenase assembly factor 2 [Rhodanobacteraceae bacterium]
MRATRLSVNMTEAVAEARFKRLQWRCRRGTRELDALLAGWLEQHGASLDEAQYAAFDA